MALYTLFLHKKMVCITIKQISRGGLIQTDHYWRPRGEIHWIYFTKKESKRLPRSLELLFNQKKDAFQLTLTLKKVLYRRWPCFFQLLQPPLDLQIEILFSKNERLIIQAVSAPDQMRPLDLLPQQRKNPMKPFQVLKCERCLTAETKNLSTSELLSWSRDETFLWLLTEVLGLPRCHGAHVCLAPVWLWHFKPSQVRSFHMNEGRSAWIKLDSISRFWVHGGRKHHCWWVEESAWTPAAEAVVLMVYSACIQH